MSKAATHTGSAGNDGAVAGLIARFAAYFAVLTALVLFLDSRGMLRWLQDVTTVVSEAAVSVLGIGASRTGTLIHLPQRTLAIDLACTAIFIVALYVALVMSYPVPWRVRLVGIAAGVVLIAVANVLRIVAAAVVSQIAPSAFMFVHDYLFQVGMILITVAAWAAWLLYLRRYA